MRGSDGMQEALFTVAKLEDFVPSDHPLRAIRDLVNEALGRLNGLFIWSTPTPAAPRSPQRNCCAPCSSTCSSRCAANAS